MDEITPRLAMPLLQPGQAEKEITHNEALAVLDLTVQASVLAVGRDDPPDAPAPGQCWIVGTAPGGDWAGRAGALAGWTSAGWRFAAPQEGFTAWSVADQATAHYAAGNWSIGRLSGSRVEIDGIAVVGPQGAAVPDPAGGSLIDAEARASLASILSRLRDHGLIAP